MSGSLAIGVALTMVAGLMSGNCMLPIKFTRSWRWEGTWLVFSIVSLVILPWILAILFVGNLFETYQALSFRQLLIPALLGAGWGIAQILFGISVKRLGLGLAYAIIVGLGAALGTLVPLFVQHHGQAKDHVMVFVLTGVAMMLLAIFVSAWGGHIKERVVLGNPHSLSRQGYGTALMLAVLCGFLAPMLNYSFAFGQDIAQAASRFGNPAVRAAYAVWPISLAGGFLPNAAYSFYLLRKNRSWHSFRPMIPDLFWPCLMGVLWMGAFALYGMSAAYLGALGTSIGWGLFQIFMIMTATLSGVLTGEWKGAPNLAKLLLSSGLAGLTGATVLLALAN